MRWMALEEIFKFHKLLTKHSLSTLLLATCHPFHNISEHHVTLLLEPVTELESSTAVGCAWTSEGEGHYSLMSVSETNLGRNIAFVVF